MRWTLNAAEKEVKEIFVSAVKYRHTGRIFLQERVMNLSDRLRAIVIAKTTEYRRFKQLETDTAIPADTWKSWFHGRQRPTADMIEAAGKTWPVYAFWLITGAPDAAYGHSAPGEEGFPSKGDLKEYSAAYLKSLIELKEAAVELTRQYLDAEGMSDVEPDDQWTRTAITVLCSSTREPRPEFEGIDLTKFKTAHATLRRADKLRRAELTVETEMPASDYDLTEMLIQRVEKTLGTLAPEAQGRLRERLEAEKNAVARNRAWEEKNPDRARELKELLQKYA